ncbi:MAG: HD domain-containing protein [Rikenellaceae bacterium]
MKSDELKRYLLREILPQYAQSDAYDKGHNCDHIEAVVAGALELAEGYDVDCDMLYTAAIFHDLGLVEGRETHHITSARMLREDSFIQGYFTPEQITIISEAIEDHRASAKGEPRSMYGKILSSADRIINPDLIIMRAYYHSLKHFANYTLEEHIDRILEHIIAKYGDNGYIKIPILTRQNLDGLQQLRSMSHDEESFRKHCRRLIELEDSAEVVTQ